MPNELQGLLGGMQATPRNKLMGLLADGLKAADRYANKPDPTMPGGKANPPLSLLSDLASLKSLAEVANNVSYGYPLTNAGVANVPFLKPETADALMMAPISPRNALAAASLGLGMADGEAMRSALVLADGSVGLKVKNLRGEAIKAPTTFYRGETPGADRVLTRDDNWNSALFAADDHKKAALYGQNVATLQAKEGANILYEGSREFQSLMKGVPKNQSLLDWGSEATRRAKAAGFDAVWFQRQSDMGTAILDRDKFSIDGQLINNTGGIRK